jgi:hypothetical protein
VVLGGGVAVHQPRLQRAVRDRLPDVEVRMLTEAPVTGAVRLAAALADPHPEQGSRPPQVGAEPELARTGREPRA